MRSLILSQPVQRSEDGCDMREFRSVNKVEINGTKVLSG